MKRHFWFIFFLVLELIYSLALFFNYNTLWMLFIANLFVLLLLFLEPYWKIGGWLIYFMCVEVFIYFLNKMTYGYFIYLHSIINAFAVLFGLVLVIAAYVLKQREGQPIDEEQKFEELRKSHEQNNIENEEKIEKPNIVSKILLASGNTVHLKDCELAKKAKDARIVNERYAKAMKMKGCKKCNPY